MLQLKSIWAALNVSFSHSCNYKQKKPLSHTIDSLEAPEIAPNHWKEPIWDQQQQRGAGKKPDAAGINKDWELQHTDFALHALEELS